MLPHPTGLFFHKSMRYIHFSIPKVTEILNDKSRMDAYAFALQIKARFTSSTLKGKNTTIKHMKTLFRMGYAKLKRCLSDAEKFGYIRREGDLIIACKLYREFELVGTITIQNNTIIPHAEVVKQLRHSIFLNKIKIVQHAGDREIINKVGRTGKKRVRNGKTIIGGLALCFSESNYVGFNFGYDEVAKMMGVSTRTAKRYVNELHKNGIIYRRQRFKSFLDKDKTRLLSRTLYEKIKSEEMENGRYLAYIDGEIWERQTNSYALTNPKDIKIYVKPHKYKFGVSKSGVSSVLSAEPVNSSVNINYIGDTAEHLIK